MTMSYIYEVFEILLRMWMGIWLHTHSITTTGTSPGLWELAEILPGASVQPCHYSLVEAVEPFKTHPMSMLYIYEVIEHLLPSQTLSQICESWLKSYLMQVCKLCHYTLVVVIEPFKLHPMSMSYIYEVFQHLLRMWMGIWIYTHTITTTVVS